MNCGKRILVSKKNALLKIFLKVQPSLIFKQLYFFFKNAGEKVNWFSLFYFTWQNNADLKKVNTIA